MSHAALRTRLPAIDPAMARLQTRLLAGLDGATGGDPGEPLTCRAALSQDAAAPVAIRFATPLGDVELAVLLADGRVPALLGDDGLPDAVPAMAALAAVEPAIVIIERRLGVALRPVAVAAPELPLRLRIEVSARDGEVRHVLELACAADARFQPEPLPPVFDAAVAAMRCPLAFVATGPRLAPPRIAALAAGDVVLCGGRQLPGHVDAAGRRWPASFAPLAATLTILEPRSPDVTEREPPATGLDPELQLPLTLRLDAGSCSLGDLAALSPGSVLPFGSDGTALPVTLEVGGAPVAVGELVAVGDSYGVLITRRIASGR